ncbi:MAG: hypothetical protein AAGF95_09590 [Chloroflexota bacterium]
MSIPDIITQSIEQLSDECGIALQITRYWENEFGPGWYCRFHGIVHQSDLLQVELAGSLTIAIDQHHKNEIDLFLFVNGVRVGQIDNPHQYLHRQGSEPLRWDDLDPGFEHQKTLAAITMSYS